MPGHRRSKNGVLLHAYVPGIHDEVPQNVSLRMALRLGLMDCRVKPGNDNGMDRALFQPGCLAL